MSVPPATIGDAYTWPSRVVENNWPKSAADTADGPRPGSFLSQPVRYVSTEIVVTSPTAAPGSATAARAASNTPGTTRASGFVRRMGHSGESCMDIAQDRNGIDIHRAISRHDVAISCR